MAEFIKSVLLACAVIFSDLEKPAIAAVSSIDSTADGVIHAVQSFPKLFTVRYELLHRLLETTLVNSVKATFV